MDSHSSDIEGEAEMSIKPQPFQLATINAALNTLTCKKSARRFLVADEVGLGKTVVASGVIQKLAEKARKAQQGPLCVLYVCSNLAIARQNMQRLLSFLPTEVERKTAIGMIDRPSLLPTQERPTHALVNVYQLTPATAVPTRAGQSRDGRKEERALALVLLRQILPDEYSDGRTTSARTLREAFQRNAGDETFGDLVQHYENETQQRNGLGGVAFRDEFRKALRELFDLGDREHLPPILGQWLNDQRHQDLVAFARTALAIAALRDIGPALVIFDEFQRFRDLTEDADEVDLEDRERAASRVMKAIHGDGSKDSPALLLLSATPYTPYRSRHEKNDDGETDSQSSDFFDLVAFLGNDKRKHDKQKQVSSQAKNLFCKLQDELRKRDIHSDAARNSRKELTELLSPLMSRTERTSINSVATQAVNEVFDEETLKPDDLRPFAQMEECFSNEHPHDRDWAVPLWQSVPMPLQTLGSKYLAWKRKDKMPDVKELDFTRNARNAYRAPKTWPHPRLRKLLAMTSQPQMVMPWLRPSLPWWPLSGGWKSPGADADDIDTGKFLVFSRFRAVPPALSSVLSFSAEQIASQSSGKRSNYEQLGKRKHWLKPRAELLATFHPSLLLAQLEPLSAPTGDLRPIKSELVRQLRVLLEKHYVRIVRSSDLQRKPWELVAALECKAGLWEASWAGWKAVADTESEFGSTLKAWNETAREPEVTEISTKELGELAMLALESPGVAFLRALKRHWNNSGDKESIPKIVHTVWNGLRNYLNQPWFAAALTDRKNKNYPAALRKAVVEGGFESVLDEHFWNLSRDYSEDLQGALSEMEGAFRLRDVNAKFHEGMGDDGAFTLRCHLAVPLSDVRASAQDEPENERPLRPDEVRRAFNSPFWPRVLVTTSIGQEGLDLHPWCDSMVHWDLAPGPVALEQREGRITRFAGLAVRRAIAKKLRNQVAGTMSGASPWKYLAQMAEQPGQNLADASGLAPWWNVDGAVCQSYVFSTSSSEQRRKHESLKQERALYRMVLGMPNQDDLMSILKIRLNDDDEADVRSACLDLCAYNLSENVVGGGLTR